MSSMKAAYRTIAPSIFNFIRPRFPRYALSAARMVSSNTIENVRAPNTPYFTPAQIPPSGTALVPQPDGREVPLLFKPIKIRGVKFQNRIFLSPLCQYSSDDGHATAWQQAHLGGIFTRGPGLTIVEATAVLPQGRITPEDAGLWKDSQIEPIAKIVEFAHSQSQKIGIQIAHAGRKASMVAPWLSFSVVATEEVGGWPNDTWAPSAVPYDSTYTTPNALTKEGIQEVVKAFAETAKRAVKAGFDVIEIHNAHGYLLHEFLSPVANKRTDEYGGSFENRTRLTLEVVDAVRAVIPESMPLFVRISGTDWLTEVFPNEPSWTIEESAKLAPLLYAHGVDLLDVSSGAIHPAQKIVNNETAYQAPLSEFIKKAIAGTPAADLIVSAVGGIRSGKLAQEILEQERADIILVGRQFQKDPATVWTFAEELGVSIKVANQIEWGFKGRGSAGRK